MAFHEIWILVSLTCDLFLLVVVVTGGEEVSEDESGDVHLLVLVFHHGDSFSIVPDGDGVGLTEEDKGNNIMDGWE